MKCPKCNEEMENLGNIENTIYPTYPAQWDDTYICRKDKIKIKKRVHGKLMDYSFLNGYKELGG